ncbi:MAG: ABC transporter permease, partial [Oscillospiraceae bacterium]|nr:ABC transporter permease [Oscillospiraceae bacterium]
SGVFDEFTNSIQYGYDVRPQIFRTDTTDGILQVNPSEVMSKLGGGMDNGGGMGMNFGGSDIWSELLDNRELLDAQYEMVAGQWPENFDEVVVILNTNNELSDIALYSLGLLNPKELDEIMEAAMRGDKIDKKEIMQFEYDDILATTFKLLVEANYYDKQDGKWVDIRDDLAAMQEAIDWAHEIKIVGIIRPKEEAAATALNGSMGYLSGLTKYIVNKTAGAAIVREQLDKPEINVFNGISFDIDEYLNSLKMADYRKAVSAMPQEQQMMAQMMTAQMSEAEVMEMYRAQVRAGLEAEASYDKNMEKLGYADIENPSAIRFYPIGFDAKQEIDRLITEYNEAQENEEDRIDYTDIVGIMTKSISNIINIVSYVLIAFVAISLVVSSIMIAIITYISVLERTKEIGILRSLGASKKDITRVFNAETIIEGFVAGVMGVGITILLNIPINMIILRLANVADVAKLPIYGAVGLIIISVVLTLVAGFIPSKMAAKRDPVVALRTE